MGKLHLELMSEKLEQHDEPLSQDLTDGVDDDDEWVSYTES